MNSPLSRRANLEMGGRATIVVTDSRSIDPMLRVLGPEFEETGYAQFIPDTITNFRPTRGQAFFRALNRTMVGQLVLRLRMDWRQVHDPVCICLSSKLPFRDTRCIATILGWLVEDAVDKLDCHYTRDRVQVCRVCKIGSCRAGAC